MAITHRLLAFLCVLFCRVLHVVAFTTWKGGPAHARRSPLPLRDADRCYYGGIDENGVPTAAKKNNRGAALKPSPSLTPLEVIEEQFSAFSSGSFSDVEDAFAFVSPQIKEKYSLDAEKFGGILKGTGYEALLGCAKWDVLDTHSPDENTIIVKMRVLPKPIPGCMRFSGVADQGGITWPFYYRWEMSRPTAGAMADCWVLDQMFPEAPPMEE